MSKMTKDDFTKALVESGSCKTKTEALGAYEGVFGVLAEALRSGQEVQVTNLGTFRVKIRSPRTGRNPRTGQIVHVGEKPVAVFKASPKLLA